MLKIAKNTGLGASGAEIFEMFNVFKVFIVSLQEKRVRR